MEDHSARLKQVEAELERTKQQLLTTAKAIRTTLAQCKAVYDHIKLERERLLNEPASETRDAKLLSVELRFRGAETNLQMAEAINALDLQKPIPATIKQQIGELALYTQFICIEANLARYKPVRRALGVALGLIQAPASAPEGRGPARTGALQAGAKPPGPQGKTGSLSAPRPTPALPARPGLPPRPGVAPRSPGPGAPPPPGLSRRPSGPQPGHTDLGEDRLAGNLNAYVTTDEGRQKLRVLYDRVADVELAVDALRGDSPGELARGMEESTGGLRQLAGKVYLVRRALAALDDNQPLADTLAFENSEIDPQIRQILVSLSPDDPDLGAPGAAKSASPGSNTLGERLRSIFKN
ncbi:MAG: hypothetical protein VKP62_09680 [Candidatus Sericytochromatia bacterium]|nr:hypothetical protein [Candidatus Sericytochromatia bacterium]